MMKVWLKWKRSISIAVVSAFFGWSAYFVSGHLEEFRPAFQVPFLSMVALYAVFSVQMFLGAMFIRDILAAYGIRPGMKVWMSIPLASGMANILLPGHGGAGLRALYLKSRYGFALTKFIAMSGAYYLLYMIVHSGIGLIVLAMFAIRRQDAPIVLMVVLSISIVSSLSPFVFPDRIADKFSQMLPRVAGAISGIRLVRDGKQLMIRLLVNCVFVFVSTVVQYRIAFGVYNIELTLSEISVFVSVRNLAVLTGLTPGGLGVVEAVAIYMGQSLDYTPSDALMVQGLVRAVSLSFLGVMGPIAMIALGLNFKTLRQQTVITESEESIDERTASWGNEKE